MKLKFLSSILVLSFLILCMGRFETRGATFTVTINGGNTGTPTAGSLRWAIQQANATPGADIIDFNLASGTLITEDGTAGSNINASMPITEEVTIDGTINSMATPWATNGTCGPVLSVQFNYGAGFDITASNVTVRGLAFRGGGYKIRFSTAAVTSGYVKGCYFGLTIAGTAAVGTIPSGAVFITSNASGVIVGGAACADRNVFIGDNDGGVLITGAAGNTIIGNYFNTNYTGTAYIDPGSPQACIRINGASLNNVIGTNASGEGNLICTDNAQAVFIEAGSNGTQIVNNKINTTLTGNGTMPTTGATQGIHATSSSDGFVENNIIAISSGHGIQLEGTTPVTCSGWTFRGNRIGIGADGTTVIAYATNGFGILTQGGAARLIFENNILGTNSGNNQTGIQCEGPATPGVNDTIRFANNKVGIRAAGTASATDYGFNKNGIFIKDFRRGSFYDNVVCDHGNGLDGTFSNGIHVETTPTLVFARNYIGVDNTGNVTRGNAKNGVFIGAGAFTSITFTNNVIGGNGFFGGTTVWNSIHHGVQFITGTYTGGTISNNYVGQSPSGVNISNANMGLGFWSLTASTISNNVVNNNRHGIFFNDCDNNIISGNTIANNKDPFPANATTEGSGILFQSGSTGNSILNNSVLNNQTGIWLRADPGGANNNTIIKGNTVNYNGYTYPGIGAAIPAGTRNATENDGQGIVVSGSTQIVDIGGTVGGEANTVYYNRQHGVLVNGSADYVEIRRNSIYCNGANATQKSTPNYAIRIMSGNGAITEPGPIQTPPVITAATGIAIANIPTGDITAGDVVEVFYDNACGCQLMTYLGDATNGGTGQWSFAGGLIPGAAYCTPGAALPGGATCPPSGMNSVTATRTTSPNTATGRTSEPMLCTPTVLPVDMISYEVRRYSSNAAILTWSTSEEKDNAYFQILRSTDGKKYYPIANIAGAGNASVVTSYEYIDENLEPGTYYYMLVQFDNDGKESMKGIRNVTFNGNAVIDVLPNAVQSGMPVRLLNLSGVELNSITMIDLNGKVVYEHVNDSSKTLDIQTYGLAPALYVIKIQTSEEVITKKIVVQ